MSEEKKERPDPPRDAVYPFHPDVQKCFPGFWYAHPAPGVQVSMRAGEGNACGHQQRAVTTWWALKMCDPMQLGLDLGAHQGLTPYCIHVDKFYTGAAEHPFYGGLGRGHVIADAADLSMIPSESVPYLASNHSLEHMGAERFGGGEGGILRMIVEEWLRVLRPDGILAMVVPDNAFWDVLKSDRDHKHAWSSTDRDFRGGRGNNFRRAILEPVLAAGTTDLVEYNTLDNHFSFNVVLRKKDG